MHADGAQALPRLEKDDVTGVVHVRSGWSRSIMRAGPQTGPRPTMERPKATLTGVAIIPTGVRVRGRERGGHTGGHPGHC